MNPCRFASVLLEMERLGHERRNQRSEWGEGELGEVESSLLEGGEISHGKSMGPGC